MIKDFVDSPEKFNTIESMVDFANVVEFHGFNTYVCYTRIKKFLIAAPWDWVALAHAAYFNDKTTLIMPSQSIEHPKCPEVKDVVWGHCYIQGWVLQKLSENTTLGVYLTEGDVKGSIPKWIINKGVMAAASTIVNLRDGMIKYYKTHELPKV